MARTTVGKLASKTAAAAKRVTVGAAKKATPTRKAPAKATPTKSAPTKSAPAKAAKATKAPVAKKSPTPVKKTTAPAKKTATTKAAPAKKASTTKAAKTAPAKKAPVTKAPAKKAPAKKEPATKATATAKKAAPAKAAPAKKAPAKKATPLKSTPAAKKATTPAKKSPAKKSAAKKGAQHASSLAVKADETPWTPAELEEVRTELTAEADRLRGELSLAERELDDLMRDAGDGAGNDQADVGSTTFERDHEMTLANNARDMLTQTEHALERIADGTYGVCERCGQPIGKNRLMAFPRATLCLTCKQKEERR